MQDSMRIISAGLRDSDLRRCGDISSKCLCRAGCSAPFAQKKQPHLGGFISLDLRENGVEELLEELAGFVAALGRGALEALYDLGVDLDVEIDFGLHVGDCPAGGEYILHILPL